MATNAFYLLGGNCSDEAFGPASCARDFDFTLTFEQTILSILPSTVLILVTPFRLIQLLRRKSKALPHRNSALKLVGAAINVTLQLALLILWSSTRGIQTHTSIPSAALCFVNSLMILGLSYAEDGKSAKPSTLLNVYLLFSSLFDATQVRTLWLTHRTNVAAVESASIGVKIVMLIFEAQPKTSYLKHPYREYPPEATSGILNLSLVWWLNSLFVTGFRKLMTTEDLFDIDQSLRSESLGERIQKAWDTCATPEGKYALPWVVAYCLRWNLLAAAFPRLCMIGFNFAQPFLISSTIAYVQNPEASINQAYGLIGATFLVYAGIAVSNVHYNQIYARVDTMFRGAMISLLFNRTMTLQDGVHTESAALTLMSTDVDNIIQLLRNINDIWARALEIAIGTYLLARQLGATCVVPLITTIACVAGQRWVASTIGNNHRRWNEAIQKRVKNTSSMLGAMKPIKISGLADQIASNIQNEREVELQTSRPFLWGIMWLNGFSNTPPIWGPIMTFIVFAIQAEVRSRPPLSTIQAFTALSIISLVTTPASKLLTALAQLFAASANFKRLQEYLLSRSREDSRLADVSSNPSGGRSDDNISNELEMSDVKKDLRPASNAVMLDNVTVFPNLQASTAALSNVSFAVEKGSLTVLLGPVGCGKSTLIKTILGELPTSSGTVIVSSKRMSFCSQNPWLLNTSIRNSICGPRTIDFDEDWYKTVLYACALDADILLWPDGDRTVIGSKGFTLSGGQKQRVALARAVYSRQDIALLDDVLSALDIGTQDMINSRLFSKQGLFHRLGTSVVLATHTVRCLSLSDQIIVFDSNGQVNMQGTYQDLGDRPEFVNFTKKEIAAADDREHNKINTGYIPEPESETARDPDNDNLMDITRSTGDMAVYAYYVRTIGPTLWIIFLVGHVVSTFTENFSQVWLNWWTAAGGTQLPLYLSIYVTLGIMSTIFTLICIWVVFLKIMPESAVQLHRKLLTVVMSAPQLFFASTDTGITLNRFSQDMSLVDMELPIALITFAGGFCNCIAQIGLISTGSTYLAITVPFTLAVIYAIQKVYLKTSRQLRHLDLENKSPIYSHFLETLDGLPTIRAFGWEQAAKKTHAKNLDLSQRPYYMLLGVQRWLNLVLDLLVCALAVIVVALAVRLRSTTSAGLLGVALNNVLTFNVSLSLVVTSWTQFETSLGAIARIKSFTATTPSENLPSEEFIPGESWPQNGAVEVSNLSATYGSTTTVLDHVHLHIAPGQKIGICGRTGSGKSSLLLTFLRLLDITTGSIVVDGVDLSTVPREIIRQRLVAVPQDPFILPGSARSNADPLGAATDEEITSALKRIGIWSALESRGGLDAVLQDQPLSQGQQQLFCLARAMLRKSKILILDEATSSVDSETDQVMQRVIKEEFKGWTIISVAHRLDTILDSDRIAVLDAGRIVEFDSPRNLLAQDSVLRQLYQS